MARVPVWMVGAALGTVALVGGGTLFLSPGLRAPSTVTPAATVCARDKASLAAIEKQIAELEGASLPADTAREMIAVIDELIAGLSTVKSASDDVIGPATRAQKRLDDIAKKLEAAGGGTPAGWTRLKSALADLAKGLKSRSRAFKDSAPGSALGKVGYIESTIKPTISSLESVRAALEIALVYDKARNGSGAEQVEALKYAFDGLKGGLALDAVPGLGAFLDAYSQALGGMSRNISAIEGATREKLVMADKALEGTGVSVENLYPGLKTEREKTQARIAALRQARSELAGRISENDCDRPPPPKDPCDAPEIRGLARKIDVFTRAMRADLAERQDVYQSAFLRFAELSRSQPRESRTREEQEVEALNTRLADLVRAEASNAYGQYGGIGGAYAAAGALASDVGVVAPSRARDRLGLRARLAVIRPAVAERTQAARKKVSDRLSTETAAWERAVIVATAELKDARRQRDRVRAELDRKTAEVVDLESAAKGFSEAQYLLFDACYPALGKDRRARKEPPPAPPGPPPAPPRPDAGDCRRGEGLVGAAADVVCEIERVR